MDYISFDEDTKLEGNIFDEKSRAIIKNKDLTKFPKIITLKRFPKAENGRW